MIMTTITMIILLTGFTIFLSSNPLTMGIMILTLALSATLMISVSLSPWIGFLVFLIYISGMLVLFSYFVAMSPNPPMPSMIISLMLLMLVPTVIVLSYTMPAMIPITIQPDLYVANMYSSFSSSTLLILALMLLLTMIIVVKLISSKMGPLRPFN